MKISNSKKELARIISENGGWRDGSKFSSQDKDGDVNFFAGKPKIRSGWTVWSREFVRPKSIYGQDAVKNWHQTVISREEYFHLYPAPDADGWIECNGRTPEIGGDVVVDVKFRDGGCCCHGEFRVADWRWNHTGCNGSDIIAYRLHKPEKVKSTAVGDDETNIAAKEELEAMEYKPSIEQLAADYRNRKDYADRKQREADAAKADAEAKLAELVAAGMENGLVLSVAEPELVITDWRDLRVDDEVKCITVPHGAGCMVGDIGRVSLVLNDGVYAKFDSGEWYSENCRGFTFIRRP